MFLYKIVDSVVVIVVVGVIAVDVVVIVVVGVAKISGCQNSTQLHQKL